MVSCGDSYELAQDEESPGWLNVSRSVWRSTIGDPKTAKSKAPVPVIPQLAQRLDAHRLKCGNPMAGPIFANSVGHPLDLNACYQRDMKDVLKRAGIWHGWHGFRRGLASNLNRLGVDDSVIQRILRHSMVATTQNHYIKTASPDAIAAMKQFSEALLCSTWRQYGQGFCAVEVAKCLPMSELAEREGFKHAISSKCNNNYDIRRIHSIHAACKRFLIFGCSLHSRWNTLQSTLQVHIFGRSGRRPNPVDTRFVLST